MSDHQEPNLDGDGANSCYSSSFQRTVVLRDWWLIKCSNEFQGKRFGVAGTETSFESRAMRVFTSSPIIEALDVFTLKASDGLCITLRGFLNKERVAKNGFKPEICREFIFGFPPCWERICNNCFQGDSEINTIDKACSPILSPCKYSNGSLEDNPAQSRDKSTVTETNIAEIDYKDGSRARDKKTAKRKSLHLQSKSGGISAEDARKHESSQVQTNAVDGSEDVNKAQSLDVEKDESEAINYDSKNQNCTSDEDHGSEGLDKAKSIDVEIDECEAINDEVISPADGCGKNQQTGGDNVDKVTSSSATGESLTSEQGRGELKVTTASPHSLLIDLDKSSKPGRKTRSKKSKKTLEIDGNVVEPMNHSRTKVKSAEKKRNLDASKIQNPTTNDGDHGSEGLNKAKIRAGNVAEEECEAINNERKLDDSKVQNCTDDEDHGSEGLVKAKSSDVEKDECVAIDSEVISSADGFGRKHSGADNVDKVTTMSATGDSLTSEQRKGELKVTTASPQPLFKDLDKSSKPGKKRKSKKSEKTLKSDSNVVEPMNHLGSEVKEAEEDLSWGKTKRKINFDVEVTPKKESKKQKASVVSTDSLGQKRSRSGRLLVSSLEFWRNQIPVYDMDRNLIQVKKGSETKFAPSTGRGTNSRKPRR